MSAILDAAQAPYLFLILFGFLPSEVWRFVSGFIAHGIDENSQIFVWVRSVATCLLAGVVAKLLLSPSGALALVPLAARFGALAAGGLAFLAFRRSVMTAVIVGETALIGAAYYFIA